MNHVLWGYGLSLNFRIQLSVNYFGSRIFNHQWLIASIQGHILALLYRVGWWMVERNTCAWYPHMGHHSYLVDVTRLCKADEPIGRPSIHIFEISKERQWQCSLTALFARFVCAQLGALLQGKKIFIFIYQILTIRSWWAGQIPQCDWA